MNLKYSGFLIFLITLVEAINAGNSTSSPVVQKQDLPAAGVNKTVDIGEQEKVKIIINDPLNNVTKIVNDMTTTKTTTTSTTTEASTTTTQATTTTTTTSPAPTPAPTPAPGPEKNSWIIRGKNNITCVIAEMAVQLNITYPAKNQALNHAIVNIPKNASGTGDCPSTSQFIEIKWDPGHSLRINFVADNKTEKYYVSALILNVNASVFSDKVGNETQWRFINMSSEFETPLDMSYKCSKMQSINMKNNDTDKLSAVLSLKDTQLEAYVNKTRTQFAAAQDCDAFDTPDIVPIAVGCALAILVFVVLVAYLIGRKRSQNRGYLSM